MHENLCTYYTILAQHAYIPTNMKRDIKIALPKFKNNASDATKRDAYQYRNLGLQNSLFKILDAILNLHLSNWNNKCNIIHPLQGGFSRSKGTVENIFIFQEAFHQSKALHCAFLDLHKAYDTVWREKLLQKLKTLNAPPMILSLAKGLLTQTSSVSKFKNNLAAFMTRLMVLYKALSAVLCYSTYLLMISSSN